jgi:hypothetical protein
VTGRRTRRVRAAAWGVLTGSVAAAILQWPSPPAWEADVMAIALGWAILAVLVSLAVGSGEQ